MTTVNPALPTSTPVVIPLGRSAGWLVGTTVAALLVWYFVGIDQGAVSIFGSDTHLHEFVHDARHLLGFPCH
jgi:hypothetical protein